MAANDYEFYGRLHVEANKAVGVGGTASYRYPAAEPAGALEGESSRMESVWRREMCHQFKIADRYSHVAAVIIRWADDLEKDLHCANEVSQEKLPQERLCSLLTSERSPNLINFSETTSISVLVSLFSISTQSLKRS